MSDRTLSSCAMFDSPGSNLSSNGRAPESGASTVDNNKLLYAPPESYVSSSPTVKLLSTLNALYDLHPPLVSYEDLHAFSVAHPARFWSVVWDEVGVVGEKGTHVVDEERTPDENPQWFAEAKVNWAENMLEGRRRAAGQDAGVALVQVGTTFGRGFHSSSVSY